MELNLCGKVLKPAELLSLNEALRLNTNLKSLQLGGNQIRDNTLAPIVDLIKINGAQDNGGIETLLLGGNKIGEKGGIQIGRALCVNIRIRWLYLDRNKLGDRGASAVGIALAWSPPFSRRAANGATTFAVCVCTSVSRVGV